MANEKGVKCWAVEFDDRRYPIGWKTAPTVSEFDGGWGGPEAIFDSRTTAIEFAKNCRKEDRDGVFKYRVIPVMVTPIAPAKRGKKQAKKRSRK